MELLNQEKIKMLGKKGNLLLLTTTLGQGGPVSDDDEGVLRIPQSSSITVSSLLDGFVSYPEKDCSLWKQIET